jgi:hypothetical protein
MPPPMMPAIIGSTTVSVNGVAIAASNRHLFIAVLGNACRP